MAGHVEPLRFHSISGSVYSELKRGILDGRLAPGERLIVTEIAGRYQISQAPVREALERLKQEGLIVGQPNKGSIVSGITAKEIKDLFVLREMIEAFAVRTSMPAMNEADYEALMCERSFPSVRSAGNDFFFMKTSPTDNSVVL